MNTTASLLDDLRAPGVEQHPTLARTLIGAAVLRIELLEEQIERLRAQYTNERELRVLLETLGRNNVESLSAAAARLGRHDIYRLYKAVLKLPRRIEPLGGQRHSYVNLETLLDLFRQVGQPTVENAARE